MVQSGMVTIAILLLVVSEAQLINQNIDTYTWDSSKSYGLTTVGAAG